MTGRTGQGAKSTERDAQPDPGRPMVYQIRIEGHLGPLWADAFDGLSITLEDDGHTLVTGPAIDQAALHGLLRKIRDLGMPLVSVILVDGGPAGVPDDDEHEQEIRMT
jgi:hypothetical protein